jgi:hypothetical protein
MIFWKVRNKNYGSGTKLSLHLIMQLSTMHENIWGSGGIAPPFFAFSTTWK